MSAGARAICQLLCLLLPMWLAGCAGFGSSETARQRTPLTSLGRAAAKQVLAADDWVAPMDQRVILVAPSKVDGELPVDPEHFHEALVRTLLARADSAQVLDWTPSDSHPALAGNQRILSSRLAARPGPLTLSDRALYPYQLTLTLSAPTAADSDWHYRLDGAFDAGALRADAPTVYTATATANDTP